MAEEGATGGRSSQPLAGSGSTSQPSVLWLLGGGAALVRLGELGWAAFLAFFPLSLVEGASLLFLLASLSDGGELESLSVGRDLLLILLSNDQELIHEIKRFLKERMNEER